MKILPTHRNILVGMAGVYAVAEQMCLHNHVPVFPGVDIGVDLMTEDGLKIQVKSACLSRHKQFPGGCYHFAVHCSDVQKRGKIYQKRQMTEYAEICDFVIMVGLTEGRFFVVPASEVKGSVLLESKNHQALKLEHGIGKYNRTAPSFRSKMLEYEDAWHLLDVNAAIENLEAVSAEGAQVR